LDLLSFSVKAPFEMVSKSSVTDIQIPKWEELAKNSTAISVERYVRQVAEFALADLLHTKTHLTRQGDLAKSDELLDSSLTTSMLG
jgi:hypothetical protein